MNAAEVARRANVGKDTLRYYEKIGLITAPPRGVNGYREYPQSVLDELRFIRLAQSVGFTLNEVKPAMPALANPKPDCPLLKQALTDQLARIATRIDELEESKATITRWLSKLTSASE